MDFSHPDLAGARWTNPGESCDACKTNGVDDDGNGYVDDWRGWDFANDDNDPSDEKGHGTHVAGTVGAVGDGVGVTGVAQQVRVMGLKSIGANGEGTAADAVSAILYAAANGAHVTNNSYGGDGFSQAMLDAMRIADSRDSLFVAAAGNSFSDNDVDPVYPAGYDMPNVVSVAATDDANDLAWFSNAGAKSVDLAAPGVDVYSTSPGGAYRFESGASTLNVNTAVRCAGKPRVWAEEPAPGFEVRVGQKLAISVIATTCAEVGGASAHADSNGH